MEPTLQDLLNQMFTPELIAELEKQAVAKANELLDHTRRLVMQDLDDDNAPASRDAQIAKLGHSLCEDIPVEHLSMCLSVAIFRSIDALKGTGPA